MAIRKFMDNMNSQSIESNRSANDNGSMFFCWKTHLTRVRKEAATITNIYCSDGAGTLRLRGR